MFYIHIKESVYAAVVQSVQCWNKMPFSRWIRAVNYSNSDAFAIRLTSIESITKGKQSASDQNDFMLEIHETDSE